MYDPAVQRALLEKLARWRQLPEGDLIAMLNPVQRLRYRPEALDDLEWDGLVSARTADGLAAQAGPVGERHLQTTNPTAALRDAEHKDAVRVTVMSDKGERQTLEAERALLAVGVVGNVEGMGLEEVGVSFWV